jgi:GntR family transcriptional repressor for pyruvate dehydrogenase complex
MRSSANQEVEPIPSQIPSSAGTSEASAKKHAKTTGSLVDATYRKILAMVTEGSLVDGERLPSEAEMASSFGVSRPVVRQALSRLQHSGVVKVKWGSGTYVQNASGARTEGASFGPVRSLDEVRHAYEYRAVIEGEAAALAARNRSPEALQAIYHALEKLEKNLGTSLEAQESDLEFHFAVSAASGNPFYLRVLRSIKSSVEFSISLSRTLSLTHPEERRLVVQAEHAAILHAIETNQPEQARAAMQNHLHNACRRLFQGPGSEDR